jgi:hypothetical protein
VLLQFSGFSSAGVCVCWLVALYFPHWYTSHLLMHYCRIKTQPQAEPALASSSSSSAKQEHGVVQEKKADVSMATSAASFSSLMGEYGSDSDSS